MTKTSLKKLEEKIITQFQGETFSDNKDVIDFLELNIRYVYQTAIEDCLKCLPKEKEIKTHIDYAHYKYEDNCDVDNVMRIGYNQCLSQLKSNLKEEEK